MHNAPKNIDARSLTKHALVRSYAKRYSNKLLACSKLAGRFGFRNDYYEIFRNAIDVNKFAFEQDTRNQLRRQEHLSNKLVLGFVGRLAHQKNPEFLLKVLQKVNRRCNYAVLVLIGDGELEEQLRRQAKEMGLKNVIFQGRTSNVHEWIQAFDVLFLPSKLEELGMALVETQASRLFCFASDHVPIEAVVTDRFAYLSLDDSADWADAILHIDLSYDRNKGCGEVTVAGYDIR